MKVTFIDKKTATFGDMCIGDTFTMGGEAYDVVDGNPVKDAVWETIADVLQIIDKYKSESEDRK